MPTENAEVQRRKDALREQLLAIRSSRPENDRRAAQRANGDHLMRELTGRHCVAAYLPLPSEPLDAALLDSLSAMSTVIVPVTVGPAPLDWCRYPAPIRRAALGIDEPAGARLGAAAVATADVVLVPALAVDGQGHRLGRGGGHYDRTLALLDEIDPPRPARRSDIIAVLYDGELLDDVPFDALDRAVSAVVTPATGLLHLA